MTNDRDDKKSEKIGWFILKFIGLFMLIWLLYPRITLPRYIIDGNTMTYKDTVYNSAMYSGEEDIYSKGKIIGIAVHKGIEYVIPEFILAEWVTEYKDEQRLNGISTRTFMGPVEVFEKASK